MTALTPITDAEARRQIEQIRGGADFAHVRIKYLPEGGGEPRVAGIVTGCQAIDLTVSSFCGRILSVEANNGGPQS